VDANEQVLRNENRININDYDEVAYWARLFGVSEEQLLITVQRVGDSVEAVATELEEGKRDKAA
jgi:hypothetical protein